MSLTGFDHRGHSDVCLLISVTVSCWWSWSGNRLMVLCGLKSSNGIVLVEHVPMA